MAWLALHLLGAATGGPPRPRPISEVGQPVQAPPEPTTTTQPAEPTTTTQPAQETTTTTQPAARERAAVESTGTIDFETPRLGEQERQGFFPYTFAGVTFTPGEDSDVGLVKNRATSACAEPPDDNQKLGTGATSGSIGFSGFPVRAAFAEPLAPSTAPVFVSVEFQALADSEVRLRLYGEKGTEIAEAIGRTDSSGGTCGFPGSDRGRTTVRVESSEAVAAVVMDISTSRVFVIDEFTFGSLDPPTRPASEVTPRSIEFPLVEVGSTSVRTVTVSNGGTGLLVVDTVLVAGANGADFSTPTDACSGAELAPGTSCTITTRFAPRAVGRRQAALTVFDNASDSPHTVVLSGRGAPAPRTPGVALATDVLDFGDEQVGKSTNRAVSVTNVGTSPLDVTALRIEGNGQDDFDSGADGCAGARLAEGETCSIEIEFRPSRTGARRATLVISHNAPGGVDRVVLQGTGSDRPPSPVSVTVVPGAESFGEVPVGGRSVRQFAVTNTGTAAAQIEEVSVTGSQGADFLPSGDTCSGQRLPPQDDCIVEVEFRPAIPGRRAATLLILHDGPDGPEEVTLEGFAISVAPPGPAVDLPTRASFGEVVVGESGSRVITVTSTGTTPLQIISVQVEATDGNDFTATSDGCSGRSLTPGGSCAVALEFRPRREGLRTATLGVAHDASQDPARVALLGTGAAQGRLTPGERGRSDFSRSVPDPTELSLDPGLVLAHAAAAALLIVLIPFPAELFNKTWEENYDKLRGRFRLRTPATGAPPWSSGIRFSLMAGVGAILYSLVEPEFGLHRSGMALALGLFVGIVVTMLAFEVPIALYTRAVCRERVLLRAYPGAVAVAVLFAALSRFAHFLPGYVYGLFAGYVLMRGRALSRADEGRSVAVASVSVLVVTVAAWFAWVPVKNAAGESSGLGVLIADNSLCAVVVMGIETLVFGLMPVRFLEGGKLRQWSRAGWGMLYGVALLGFIHVLVDPGADVIQRTDQAAAAVTLVPFLIFGALSIGFWAYCVHHFRDRAAAV